MIVIIDYGMGNIGSVKNAIDYHKIEYRVSRDPDVIKKASKLILPGVGSFRKAMYNLDAFKLREIINIKVTEEKTPILGICLGMQLFADQGEEDAEEDEFTKGFGWISGDVTKIETSSREYRLPHMGFNSIRATNDHAIMTGIPQGSHFYFVHSYQFKTDPKNIIAVTDYGSDIVAIVAKENIFGVQFHPEKSQEVGLKLISNFLIRA